MYNSTPYSAFYQLANQSSESKQSAIHEDLDQIHFQPSFYRSFSEPLYQTELSSHSETPIYRSISTLDQADASIVMPSLSSAFSSFSQFADEDDLSIPTISRKKELHLSDSLSDFHISPTSSIASLPSTALLPAPVYYERFSSFFSASEPSSLVRHIVAALDVVGGVDFSIDPTENKIRGVVFHESLTSVACRFQFQLYIMVEIERTPQMYLCECQRRNGCVLAFTNFFRRVAVLLMDVGVVDPTSPNYQNFSLPTRASAPPPLPASPMKKSKKNKEHDTVVLGEACFASLAGMLNSDDCLNQKQALASLASLASAKVNQQFLASPAQFSILLKTLMLTVHSADPEIVLPSISLIANLSMQESVKVSILNSFLSAFTPYLSESSSSSILDKQIRRHICSCLFALSLTPSLAFALRKQLNFVSISSSVLRALASSSDPRIKGPITKMMKNVFH